MVSPYI